MKLTGFQRWGEATAKVMQRALKGQEGDKASHERAMASLGYDLYGHPEPNLPGPSLSPLEQFQIKLFHGYMEIYKTVEALKNIEIYMAVFPHGRNKKIERSAYLSYHFENFLNEIYVLRNRLVAYVN